MTKHEAALRLYEFAKATGDPDDYKAAADALAPLVKPPKSAPKSKRVDVRSKAYAGRTWVKWIRCKEGHEFNGAGCKVCPYCTQERWARMPKADPATFRPSNPIHRGWATPWP